MAISKAKKQELVESYIKQLDRSPAIMLVEYRGMTVQQLQELRRRLREQGATVQVAKNTLLILALKRTGRPVPEDLLAGPTAIAYLPDDIATAAKTVLDYTKDVDKFVIKGAILETSVLDAEAARGLREMPSRATVLAQLLGVLQGPASQLVRTIEGPAGELYRTIQAPLRELALTIQAYSEKDAQANA